MGGKSGLHCLRKESTKRSLFSPETEQLIYETRKMGGQLSAYLDELRKKRTLDLFALPREQPHTDLAGEQGFDSRVAGIR
jgi:hypothetical protein